MYVITTDIYVFYFSNCVCVITKSIKPTNLFSTLLRMVIFRSQKFPEYKNISLYILKNMKFIRKRYLLSVKCKAVAKYDTSQLPTIMFGVIFSLTTTQECLRNMITFHSHSLTKLCWVSHCSTLLNYLSPITHITTIMR